MELLRKELTEVATAWNHQIISQNCNSGPSKQRDIMFFSLNTFKTGVMLRYCLMAEGRFVETEKPKKDFYAILKKKKKGQYEKKSYSYAWKSLI